MKGIALAVLTLCLLASTALAQTNSGRLVGTVSDPSGVIPGATVVVKDNQTGKERTIVASDDGSFAVAQLDPGVYTVTITAQGHKTFTAKDLKIDIGKDYSLNATLDVGEISENITVTAGADVINSANAELSNTVSPMQIQTLPLNGRNPLSLIQLQAGTASNGAQQTSINGQRPSFNNTTRDGVNVNDNFIRANATDFAPERPTSDDVDEFTLTTQNASADLNGGSQVQLVTPRGQTDFHGALFFYNRPSVTTANDFFSNAAGNFAPNDAAVLQGRAIAGGLRQPRPFLNRNQFGGKISGPAPLPRFGEGGRSIIPGKLFFFGAYEGLRLRRSSSRTRLILTPNARQGLFTFRDSGGTLRTVNLFALPAAPGSGGVPVPTGIDPVVQSRIINNLPASGNRSDLGDNLNTTGFGFDQGQATTRNSYTARIDLDINSRNSINFVYTFKNELNQRPDADAPNGYGLNPVVDQGSKNRLVVLAYRMTPTANLTNEVRGGIFRSVVPFLRNQDAPSFLLGGAISPAVPNTAAANAIVNNPEVNFLNQGRSPGVNNLQDNADYLRGNHSFRFGVNYQSFKVDPFNDAGIVPTLYLIVNNNTPQLTGASFAGILPAGTTIDATQLATANRLYALLGGIVGDVRQTFNVTGPDSGFVPNATSLQVYKWENYAFYASDQWRVRPRLTVNLGLRYELQTPLRNTNKVLLEPVITGDPVAAVTNPNGTYNIVGTNAGGSNVYKMDKNNFAPVISIAWSPQFRNKFMNMIFPGEGRTVLRGGYRISYVNDENVTAPRNALIGNIGLGATVIQGTQIINGASTTQVNGRLSTPPTGITPPAATIQRTFAQNNALAGNFGTVFAVDPNIKTPQIYEYNFSIQREIGFQTALEVRYVGSYGKNLTRVIDYNQVNIRSNGFLDDFLRARANLANTGNAFCNPAVTPNCQALQIFGTAAGSRLRVANATTGALAAATFNNNLNAGTPGELAFQFVQNTATNGFPILANPNTGVANLLQNGARYNYNALQVELRRRFAKGLYFQANYTFQKTLTDAIGVTQARLDTFLDNANPQLDYSRAEYDSAHVLNINGIYELPFGRGKLLFSDAGSWLDRIVGGWQVTGIMKLATGAPLTISDAARGTLNRNGRSARNTANSTLSKAQIKDLIGIYNTPCGVFYINPIAVNINLSNCTGTGTANPAYFTQAAPGQTGNLERGFINGPLYTVVDASLIKNIRITERVRFQMRVEAFNLFNHTNFGSLNGANNDVTVATGQYGIFNVNSPTFGRLTTTVGPVANSSDTFRVLQFAGRIEF
ncbi:MAG TPA: carboxypeptidase-like regulatory domain-containing protein [Pyrinomonadaceae bacterium]|jgi:hypothetical protein